MTYQPKYTITDQISSDLARIERLRGFLAAATLSEQWISEMQERAFVQEAHSTTHIEGTQLTLRESEQVLAGDQDLMVDPDDRQEVLNYKKAFDLVSNYLNSQQPITQGLVRDIHSCLVEGVRGNAAAPGEWRKVQNYVINSRTQEVIYTPPPAYDIPRLMTELVDWIEQQTTMPPVLVAGIAQFQFVHIHPFLDGNGRAARLLSALCLYRSGYDFKRLFSLSEYYDRDRLLYYRAIQGVRDNGMDLTGWLEYFVAGLATQLYEVEGLAQKALILDNLVAIERLSALQQNILHLTHAHQDVSIKELEQRLPDVSRRTIQRALHDLTKKGVLIAQGATTNRRYQIGRLS